MLSALFVLLMPTWLSAMKGYTADIEGFVADTNNNLVPAEDFLPVIYTIHDGDRLGGAIYEGLPRGHTMGLQQLHIPVIRTGCEMGYVTSYTTNEYHWMDDENEIWTLLWRLSEYTWIYGILGLNATETEFTFPNDTNVMISEPSLSISANFAFIRRPYAHLNVYRWHEMPFGTE